MQEIKRAGLQDRETVDLKNFVRDHWEKQPCGTRDMPDADRKAFFDQLEKERYLLEPYISGFARFEQGRGKKILEIGVGAGTDFINWVRHGARATGIDLTEQGVQLTRERLRLEGLEADVRAGDAENLIFDDDTFDIVYAWGVLHHTPNTPKAIREVHRVLKPGGRAIIMIYHVPCWTGFMLWGVHCLGKLKPWKNSKWAIYNYLESPGTKAYTMAEAQELFSCFPKVSIRPHLGHGDLLLMRPEHKYQKWYYNLAWAMYPRWAIKLAGDNLGVYLFIEAAK